MQESLDMPVGILNLSLGGSSIASWLSRDAVDGCDSVKNDFVNNNRYIEKWNRKLRRTHIYNQVNFEKGVKTVKWRKDSLFNKWCWSS